MTKSDYTAKYAEKLKALYPVMQVSVTGELELTVKVGDSHESRHWLDNSFSEYRSAPENFDEIVARYGKAALPRDRKGVVLSQIVPIVKDTGWIRETNAAMKASQGSEVLDYVSEEICEGLVILYAQDTGDAITYLHVDELKPLNISTSDLRSLALKNLQSLLKKIERHASNGVYFYSAGGTYEASLILYSWMWNQENFGLPGHVIFAVPTRDVLLATSSENPEGIARIRAAVKELHAGNPNYRLTAKLFRVSDGKILPFEILPNKSLQPTATAVMPPAGQEARQP